MDKLVQKFEDIGCYSSFTNVTAEKCTEEARKIAVEFAKYEVRKVLKEFYDLDSIPINCALVEGDLVIKGGIIFNEFLETYE